MENIVVLLVNVIAMLEGLRLSKKEELKMKLVLKKNDVTHDFYGYKIYS
jgi:hypothetical protein